MGNFESDLDQLIEQKIVRILARVLEKLGGAVGSDRTGSNTDAVAALSDDTRRTTTRRAGKKKKRKAKKKSTVTTARKKRNKRAVAMTLVGAASRDAIVNVLMQKGPLKVAQIEKAIGLTQTTVNRHLRDLKTAKVVATVRDGKRVLYKAVHDGRAGRKTEPPVSAVNAPATAA
jgi:DNA-binding transcriptional ArsR family regulator